MLLVSDQRTHFIANMRIDNMKCFSDKCWFYIHKDDFKQGRNNFNTLVLEFKKYPLDKSLCVYDCLSTYSNRVSSLRGSEQSLFVTICKPHKDHQISVNTVSRWVGSVLKKAGIDTTCFAPGSARAAAASKANIKGVLIDDILKAGGWSRSSTFAKHYNKPLLNQDSHFTFAESVLPL